ncbi:ankyrin repeat domain-containing protein [Leifsonia sp. LS-T14]|uniref:ankyrin repeat domain-containing protein n=1 Tax=unclassified Leifsonia TaxID=2663824 RepID=UPI0035A6F83A
MAMRAFGVNSVLLDGEEDLDRIKAYNAYIDKVRPTLPASVLALLEVSVHDGSVVEWIEADGVIELTFIADNTVESLSRITLRFFGAFAVANDRDDIATLRLLDGHTELLSNEFDVLDSGAFRYQILVTPTGELAITFTDVEIHRSQATTEEYDALGRRPNTGRWGRWVDAWLADELPLHRAAQFGDTDEITRLLGIPTPVDEEDPDDRSTALHAAARRAQVESMRLLLDAGADIDHLDMLGRTALAIAATEQDDRGFAFLLDAGADVNAGSGTTALMETAVAGSLATLRRLLGAGAAVDVQDDDGWTALMHAADADRDDAIRILIEAGADPTIRSEDGSTAADIALTRNRPDMAELLWSNGQR